MLLKVNLCKLNFNAHKDAIFPTNFAHNWASSFKNMPDSYGLGNIWLSQNNVPLNDKSTLSIFKERLMDINIQNLNEQITNVSKNRLYKTLNEATIINNKYLYDIKEKYIRINISKFR